MSSSGFTVRRATLEDVGPLTELWKSMGFNLEDLARHVTEFQVALDESNTVLGAVAIQITERQGLLHSEAFTDFSLADRLRPLIWERFQSIALSHGLLRLWTREQSPFWSHHCGLSRADAAALEVLPSPWRVPNATWLTLKLRDDPNTTVAVDKEFGLFMQMERQRTEAVIHRAKLLRNLATLLAFVFLAAVIGVGVYLLRNRLPFWHH